MAPQDVYTMDPVAEQIVPDPCDPPTPCSVFEGLLGRGCCEGSHRLYYDHKFDEWIEFRDNDLKNVSNLDGRSVVRVARDAVLLHTRVVTASCGAQGMLSGMIIDGGGATSGGGGLPIPPSRPPATNKCP